MDDANETPVPPSQSSFLYRPNVQIGAPDLVFKLGPYTAALCSGQLESLGLVTYHHLLAVWDEAFNDLFFAAAESNPIDGADVIYLGQFTPTGHSTLTSSRLLAEASVFFPVACHLARRHLELDHRQGPLGAEEDAAIAQIPAIYQRLFQDGMEIDESGRSLIEMVMEGVLAANRGASAECRQL